MDPANSHPDRIRRIHPIAPPETLSGPARKPINAPILIDFVEESCPPGLGQVVLLIGSLMNSARHVLDMIHPEREPWCVGMRNAAATDIFGEAGQVSER
jgi:hypothetical protein